MSIGPPDAHLVHVGRQNVTKINIDTPQLPNCQKKKKIRVLEHFLEQFSHSFYLNFLPNTHTNP